MPPEEHHDLSLQILFNRFVLAG